MESRAPSDDSEVIALYQKLLDAWNRRAADDFAALFSDDGHMVGFDGSQADGRLEIASHLRPIFADHPTPAYVGKVRGVRFLGAHGALLRAVAGLVPSGQTDLNPALNAVQTLVAAKTEGKWRVEMFQNTPAAFHGRPELAEALTEELRNVLRA